MGIWWAGWGTFLWKFCWNTDLTSVFSHSQLCAHRPKWVSRTTFWLQQNCHPFIYPLTFNHSFFKNEAVCVCVCVYHQHAMISQSLAQWQRHSFLCISFQFNRADSHKQTLSTVWGEPGWGEMQSAKAAHWAHPIQKMTPFLQENPLDHTLRMYQMSELKGEEGCSQHYEGLLGNQGEGETQCPGHHWWACCVKPRTPVCWKYGRKMLAAMTATESGRVHEEPVLAQNHVPSFGRRGIQSGDLLIKVLKKPNDLTWRFCKI